MAPETTVLHYLPTEMLAPQLQLPLLELLVPLLKLLLLAMDMFRIVLEIPSQDKAIALSAPIPRNTQLDRFQCTTGTFLAAGSER